MHGIAQPLAPTPSAPATAPRTGAVCKDCGYKLPAGEAVSWCPGCGRLFDNPASRPPPVSPPSVPIPSAPAMDSGERTQTHQFRADTAPPSALAPPPISVPPGWSLVLLKAGERLDRYPLRKAEILLGRSDGDYTFPEDAFLSPCHARITCRDRSFWLEDAGSRNGVFLRLREAVELRHGDVVALGGLVLRYESAGEGPRSTGLLGAPDGVKFFGSGRERARGRAVRVLQDGSDGPAYPLTPSRTIFGRKMGHFLFPDDALLSRQHAQFYERDGEMWVEDLGSSNGTLLRARGPVALEKGLVFRIGDLTLEVVAP